MPYCVFITFNRNGFGNDIWRICDINLSLLSLCNHMRFGFISDGLFSASILTPATRTGSLTVSTGSEIGHDVLRSSNCRLIKPCLLVRSFQATCYHCRTLCSETTPVESADDETYYSVRLFVSVHCCITCCLPMTACIETRQRTAASRMSVDTFLCVVPCFDRCTGRSSFHHN